MPDALSFLWLLLLASYVSAHGFVYKVHINGELKDTGPLPGQGNGAPSAIRGVSTQDPQYGLQNPGMNCGPGARPAQNNLRVPAGATMGFDWKDAALGLWAHDTGPLMNYMASCGDVPCSEFDSTKARWFKIDQQGQGGGGRWAQADLMSGGLATLQLPSNLAPGNYLVRHEIIALHRATIPPSPADGAEFYASCIQIILEGSGNGRPNEQDLVSFPGGYNGDPNGGIFVPNLYGGGGGYNFPGPQVAALVNSGNPGPNRPSNGDVTTASSSATSPGPTSRRNGASRSSSETESGPSGTGAGRPAPTKSSGCGKKKTKRRVLNRRQFKYERRFVDPARFRRRFNHDLLG